MTSRDEPREARELAEKIANGDDEPESWKRAKWITLRAQAYAQKWRLGLSAEEELVGILLACPERAHDHTDSAPAPDALWIKHAQEALKVLQEKLGSHNEENPWLGICAAVALLLPPFGGTDSAPAPEAPKCQCCTGGEECDHHLEMLVQLRDQAKCACGYDQPGPCDYHKGLIVARVERLESELSQIRTLRGRLVSALQAAMDEIQPWLKDAKERCAKDLPCNHPRLRALSRAMKLMNDAHGEALAPFLADPNAPEQSEEK